MRTHFVSQSAIAVVLLGSALALADTLHLKSGRTLEGKVVGEDATNWKVQTRYGTQTVPKAQVTKIDYGPTRWEQYAEKRKAIVGKKDAALHVELAKWCEGNALPDDAKKEWQTVVALAPDHAEARAKLGFVRFGDAWVTEKERDRLAREAGAAANEAEMRAKGLVPHEGKWVTPEAKHELEQKAKGLVKVGDRWIPADHAKADEEAAAFGRATDLELDAERRLGFRFVKRETPDAVVASLDSAEDAKALAGLAIRMATRVRQTLPEARRAEVIPGPMLVCYSLPKGEAMEAFLAKVCGPAGAATPADLDAIRLAGAWTCTGDPPFVFVERRPTEGLLEGTGGALVVHGLAHGITRRFGRAGYGVVAPWIHEGLACWLDGEIQPKGANCCQSMDKRGGWEAREKWAELLKAAVTSGQDPPLADIVKAADVDALGGAGLAKAAAVLGWIGARADGTLWDLVAAASALGGEKGIARVLGKPVAEVDAEWRTSVKK